MLNRRLWIMFAAVLCGLAFSASVQGQNLLKHQMHPLLQSQLRFLQFRVVMGRIEVTTDDPIRNFGTSSKQGETTERLSIEFGTDTLSLDYTLSMPQGDFSVRVVDSREVIVRKNPAPGQKQLPVLFVQPREGLMQLIVGSGETAREVRAHSLWQIMLAEPEICRTELTPLLQLLRPTWKLHDTFAELETSLVTWNAPSSAISGEAIQTLVTDLGGETFAEREMAERQLTAVGSQVVTWLRRLDLANLDAEQRFRIRRIMDDFGDAQTEDTSNFAVRWLAVDPQTWALLLNRDDMKLRQLALEKLTKLVNRPIQFDPTADDTTRQKQWAEVLKQVENAK
jgi:hypothetical protein